MPFPGGTYLANIIGTDNWVYRELDQFYGLFQGWASVEHDEDGHHTDVTADSVVVESSVTVSTNTTIDSDGIEILSRDGTGAGQTYQFSRDYPAGAGQSIDQFGIAGYGAAGDTQILIDNIIDGLSAAAGGGSATAQIQLKTGGWDGSTVGAATQTTTILMSSPSASASTGSITLSAQDVVLSLGHLSFPAGQNASTGANTLDDYEEGSWTPTVISAGGGTPTYGTQVGRYTKVGRIVIASGRVTLTAKGTLAAGNAAIDGLPFTSDTTANVFGGCVIPLYANMAINVASFNGYVSTNSTFIQLLHMPAAGAASVSVTQVADISATFDAIFTATYLASA